MNDFSSPTGIAWGNAEKTYGQVKYGDDSRLAVMFYPKSTLNVVKSREEGIRVYDTQTYIRIHTPGEMLNIIDRPIQENDKHRFPKQWTQFLQHKQQVPEGTPVDLLFPNDPAIADNLKSRAVHTVQQLSKLSSNAMDTIGMGAQQWVTLAKQYLENASSGSAFLHLQEELKKEKQSNKLLQKQFDQLKDQFAALKVALVNPGDYKLQPDYKIGFDDPVSKINQNHPSKELAKRRGKKPREVAPPQEEIEQFNAVDEEVK